MILKSVLLVTVLLFGFCTTNQNQFEIMDQAQSSFDIERYLGTWYEIARFDHRFERGLEGVTATYSKNDKNLITVENQGYSKSLTGEKKVAIGKAKIVDLSKRHLKVSFFWFFYADYNILYIDPNYQHALIGSRSPNYFWILSREPHLDQQKKQELIQIAQKKGYNTDKLIWVQQK